MKIFDSFTDKYLSWQISEKAIEQKDLEIHRYGINKLIGLIFSLLICLVFGRLFHVLGASVVYWFAFFMLRTYAGGFHFASPQICFWISILIDGFSLGIVSTLSATEHRLFLGATLMISSLVIYTIAPVETPNKPLDEMEKRIYGKRARIVLLVIVLLAVVFHLLAWEKLSLALYMTTVSSSFICILGYCSNIANKVKNHF